MWRCHEHAPYQVSVLLILILKGLWSTRKQWRIMKLFNSLRRFKSMKRRMMIHDYNKYSLLLMIMLFLTQEVPLCLLLNGKKKCFRVEQQPILRVGTLHLASVQICAFVASLLQTALCACKTESY